MYDATVIARFGGTLDAAIASAGSAVADAAPKVVPGALNIGVKVVGGTVSGAATVLLTPSPAGESEADLAKTRAIDAHGLQALEKSQYPYVDSHARVEGRQALADFKQCHPDDFKSSGSAGALRNAMKPNAGEHLHHLVEQNQTSRFGTDAIQNTKNAVNLPARVHTEVNRIFAQRPEVNSAAARGGYQTRRAFVQSLPYDAQRQFGIDTVRQAMKNVDVQDSSLEHRLDSLEADPCLPGGRTK